MYEDGTWDDGNVVATNVQAYACEWSADCNNDGIIDYGQILNGSLADLNRNGVPDACDPKIRVPQDRPTIQSAVDAAAADAIILVAPGSYTESVSMLARDAVIAPQDAAIGFSWSAPAGQRAVRFVNTAGARQCIAGATFIGHPTGTSASGGVLVSGASPRLEGCSFRGVRSTPIEGNWGGAADIGSGMPVFKDCAWEDCRSSNDGGAVTVRGGTPIFEDCQFRNNGPSQGADMFTVGPAGTTATLTRCDFSGVSGGGFGARIYNYGSGGGAVRVQLNDCVFHDIDQIAISLVHGWDSITANGVEFRSCVVHAPRGAYSVLMTQSRSRLNFQGGVVQRCEALGLFGADPTQGGNAQISNTLFCLNTPALPGWSTIVVDAGGNQLGCPCEGDLDGNSLTDTADISLLLLDFGSCEGCPSDLDRNGQVDTGDVGIVLLNFGPCPTS